MGKDWSGARVYFWGADAKTVYGTVLDAGRLSDGTQVLIIRSDHGRLISLPAAGVTVVQESESDKARL